MTRLLGWIWLILLIAVLGAFGCVAEPGPDAGAGARCVPGMSIACACPSGLPGAQTCQPNETYAPCLCDDRGRDAGEVDARGSDVADSDIGPDSPLSDASDTNWVSILPLSSIRTT
jgi:hypothetical protein